MENAGDILVKYDIIWILRNRAREAFSDNADCHE